MNKYEAMIIFPESMKEEDLETALEKIGTEIEKLGGTVGNKTRLGRRTFARPMQKHTAGQYSVVGFSLEMLQTFQVDAPRGLVHPLDMPLCFPRVRVPYDKFDGAKISHMTKVWHAGLAMKDLGWTG